MGAALKLKLFYCYAPRDETFCADLDRHLTLLKTQGIIESWHPGQLTPGDRRDDAVVRRLDEADIILLLVSADFLASSDCYDVQMKRALQRDGRGEARVIPII